jgi:undecaprenyl-diphosphatase
MSDYLLAIVLGIVQGLTEFLPVSSSGHLELAKYFLGDNSVAKESLIMTIVLHAATALSTIVVFRHDIWRLLRGLLSFKWNEETIFCLKIVISMIPAAFVGLFYEDALDALFNKQVVFVSLMLLVTGALLLLADRAKRTDKDVSYRDALLVGIAQAIAILPGISRSGATISSSVLLGIDREQAARFSFLMVVPLIMGKIAKDLLDGDLSHTANVAELSLGFVAAFLTGLLACTWMIRLVKSSRLTYFAIYCFAVGLAAIAIITFTQG